MKFTSGNKYSRLRICRKLGYPGTSEGDDTHILDLPIDSAYFACIFRRSNSCHVHLPSCGRLFASDSNNKIGGTCVALVYCYTCVFCVIIRIKLTAPDIIINNFFHISTRHTVNLKLEANIKMPSFLNIFLVIVPYLAAL